MAKYVKLSYDCDPGAPYPPGVPVPQVTKFTSICEGDVANQFMLTLCNHTGTHVDAPAHVVDNGLRICDMEIAEFVYSRPVCVFLQLEDMQLILPSDLEKYAGRLAEADLLLIATGYCRYRVTDPERYKMRGPGLSSEAASYIASNFPSLRALGVDTISLAAIQYLDDGMEAHRVLLGRSGGRFLVYEAMNLEMSEEELSKLVQVIALPLIVKGVDSGPCTILGVLQD